MPGDNQSQGDGPDQQLLPARPSSQQNQISEASSLEKDVRRKWHAPRSQTLQSSMRLWWFEVLGITTSVAALLAIFGILFACNDKPLSDWNAALRPNTIVAVLSTVSKSAMLMVVGQCIGQLKWVYFEQRPHRLRDIEIFDDASRGPLGSTMLLVHINWTALLASGGAILTLLSLAMEPFVQQVMSYDTVTFNDTSVKGSFSTARVYDTGLSATTGGRVLPNGAMTSAISRRDGAPDLVVAGAIYKGIFGNMYKAPIDCLSGNCTWTPLESLGVCSSCVDVTSMVKKNCTYEWRDWIDTLRVKNRTCLTRSPRGNAIETVETCPDAGWSATTARWNTSVMTHDPNISHRQSVLSKDGTIAIVATALFRGSNGTEQKKICQPAEIHVKEMLECTLKWCVKTYGGPLIQNGMVNDLPSGSEPLDFVELETCDGLFDRNDGFQMTTWNLTKGEDKIVESRDLRPAFRQHEIPQYACPKTDLNAMQEDEQARELGAMFQQGPNAFLVNAVNNQDIQDALKFMFQGGLDYHFKVGEDTLKLALREAHETGKCAELMERVAESMTSSIRHTPNGTLQEGTMQWTEIRIVVHWPWMVLPCAVVLFSTALLSISIVVSYEKQRTVWKSSLLASLFHGLQGWRDDELDALKLEDMERRAKEMRASLKPGLDGSIKLVKHE
ncbi:hypothetical protein CKM354_001005600 [Cercospora kikuchii]|uniref:Uncharacterized protein n=1 Tax=Cercospora kikuchii TaxID=84275 RepID=A0A9P3CQ85_9PEZI|nr:uncharacterized protein CKM354_001005600 [Cercospora kikuchii]GIZ46954.1 hypothetical protein CKM354_001005600 [Cercospora kikuchii]